MEAYMRRAIEIARFGEGFVAPNPMVGCVIVADNQIIGEGWHRAYGEAHAEVRALEAVSNKDLLRRATLYVTLEPCSHYGKTPPCAKAIVDAGIQKVVIATLDPNPLVAGRGMSFLKAHGIAVSTRLLAKEARYMNRRFLYAFEHSLPYVVLKWAESADRFMDPLRSSGEQGSIAISSRLSRQDAHRLRAAQQAILVGKNTALIDNPALTLRHWPGRNPTRILLDAQLEVPRHFTLFDDSARVLVFNRLRNEHEGHVEFCQYAGDMLEPAALLQMLQIRGIQSVLVEGGRNTLQQFIDAGLWNEVWIYQSSQTLQHGLPAPTLPSLQPFAVDRLGEDLRMIYLNTAITVIHG